METKIEYEQILECDSCHKKVGYLRDKKLSPIDENEPCPTCNKIVDASDFTLLCIECRNKGD